MGIAGIEWHGFKFNVAFWLQADIQSPEIEVRFTPNFGRGRGGSRESEVDPTETFRGTGSRSENFAVEWVLEPHISNPAFR